MAETTLRAPRARLRRLAALTAIIGALTPFAAPAHGQSPNDASVAGVREYDLDVSKLGGAGAPWTPAHRGDAGDSGIPVAVVLLTGGAGVAVGGSAWRLRRQG